MLFLPSTRTLELTLILIGRSTPDSSRRALTRLNAPMIVAVNVPTGEEFRFSLARVVEELAPGTGKTTVLSSPVTVIELSIWIVIGGSSSG